MSVSRRVLARHIAQQLADGGNRAVLLRQLAAYLIAHKQVNQLEMVISDIARNLAELGTVRALVTVAHPLDAQLRRDVEEYIRQLEDATSVQITEAVDPDLLGGIIIETPRKRFDASVSTQLKRLKNV